jgi:ubiquinone/menaquinone biosynthesis C-methylase UbiE
LDIGCGLGGKTIAYGEAGAKEIFGADLSIDHVRASQRFAGATDRPFRWGFFVADAERLPSAEGAFDTVVANDAMEHFSGPESALGEMIRVTRTGGAIWLFFTPHFSPLGSHLYDYIHTPWCHLVFRRGQLERAVRSVLRSRNPGWKSEEVEAKVRAIMTSYDKDLNHMTIRRFRHMLANFPDAAVTYSELKPAKYAVLGFLTKVPIVQELIVGTVVCRLERLDRGGR